MKEALRARASVQVGPDAVRQAHRFATAKVAAALHSGQFTRIIGQVWLNAKGDILGAPTEWLRYRWLAGKIEHAGRAMKRKSHLAVAISSMLEPQPHLIYLPG
jgi:hypothetical protein